MNFDIKRIPFMLTVLETFLQPVTILTAWRLAGEYELRNTRNRDKVKEEDILHAVIPSISTAND